MLRSLQITWAKLCLATHARFTWTAEEERQDTRWVADDEVFRVTAEGAAKKAEDADQIQGAVSGWYEAAEEGPSPPPRRRPSTTARW
jgi:hypothetical protein